MKLAKVSFLVTNENMGLCLYMTIWGSIILTYCLWIFKAFFVTLFIPKQNYRKEVTPKNWHQPPEGGGVPRQEEVIHPCKTNKQIQGRDRERFGAKRLKTYVTASFGLYLLLHWEEAIIFEPLQYGKSVLKEQNYDVSGGTFKDLS